MNNAHIKKILLKTTKRFRKLNFSIVSLKAKSCISLEGAVLQK